MACQADSLSSDSIREWLFKVTDARSTSRETASRNALAQPPILSMQSVEQWRDINSFRIQSCRGSLGARSVFSVTKQFDFSNQKFRQRVRTIYNCPRCFSCL